MSRNLLRACSGAANSFAGIDFPPSPDGRRPHRPAARRTDMRNSVLFWAVATMAFFVTLETPARPEAGFRADFEPGMQVDVMRSAC
jgi:hypothetical protein